MKLPFETSVSDPLCTELACHDALTLLLDLDGTLIPFAPTTEAANLDLVSVDCDIERALTLPLVERRVRHEKLVAALANKSPQRWAAAFLDKLESTRVAC